MQKQQRQQYIAERGNVFFYILLAIGLLAALTFAVSKGGQQNATGVSAQQAQLAANEIINYGNTVTAAVQKLKLRGCADTEISFENDIETGYTNANAPADNSCHVFDLNGGALELLEPDESYIVSGAPYRAFRFTAGAQIDQVGTNATDLRMTLNFIKEDICIKLNELLLIDNPSNAPPVDVNTVSGFGIFTGAYNTPLSDNVGDDGGHNLSGQTAFCREGNAGFQYNNILIAR